MLAVALGLAVAMLAVALGLAVALFTSTYSHVSCDIIVIFSVFDYQSPITCKGASFDRIDNPIDAALRRRHLPTYAHHL